MTSLHEEFLVNLIAEEQPALVGLQLGILAADFSGKDNADHFLKTNIDQWIENSHFYDDLAQRKFFAYSVQTFAQHVQLVVDKHRTHPHEVIKGIFYPHNDSFTARHFMHVRSQKNWTTSYQINELGYAYKETLEKQKKLAHPKSKSAIDNLKIESKELKKQLDMIKTQQKISECFDNTFYTDGFYNYEKEFEDFGENQSWVNTTVKKLDKLEPAMV